MWCTTLRPSYVVPSDHSVTAVRGVSGGSCSFSPAIVRGQMLGLRPTGMLGRRRGWYWRLQSHCLGHAGLQHFPVRFSILTVLQVCDGDKHVVKMSL
jgi:hypothetical protein